MEKVASSLALTLAESILDGTFSTGVRLPSERALGTEYGASRVSVREALQELASFGVVEVRSRDGAVVRPRHAWNFGVVPLFIRRSLEQGRLDALEVFLRDALGLRRSLVLDMIGRAAGRFVPGALDAARREVRLAWAGRETIKGFMEHDIEMNRRILEAADMPASLWLFNTIADPYLELIAAIPGPVPVSADYLRIHERLFAALERGDTKRAVKICSDYMAEHEARVLGALGLQPTARRRA